MKQAERNRITRERIMTAALDEFGAHPYSEASINTICAKGGIPKGNLYHQFEDKDSLYLACIRATFQALLDYLTDHFSPDGTDVRRNLSAYFEARQNFFETYPHFQSIFYQASLMPPVQLRSAIAEARAPFDAYNSALLADILKGTKLRPGITTEDLSLLQMLYQRFLNRTDQMRAAAEEGPQAHEALCMHWIEILLYGVTQPEPNSSNP